MRRTISFALLLASGVAAASPGVTPAKPSHPQEAWIGKCVAHLQRVADQLNASLGEHVLLGTIGNAMEPDHFKTFWQPDSGTYSMVLRFSQYQPPRSTVDDKWSEETVETRKASRTLKRYAFRAGRSLNAELAVAPDAPRGKQFLDDLSAAVDACITGMPQSPAKKK